MFLEIPILEWLSIWDSPGIQKPELAETKFTEISEFWKNRSLKQICVHTELKDKSFGHSLKVDETSEMGRNKQIHSVIVTWKTSGPSRIILYFILFYKLRQDLKLIILQKNSTVM